MDLGIFEDLPVYELVFIIAEAALDSTRGGGRICRAAPCTRQGPPVGRHPRGGLHRGRPRSENGAGPMDPVTRTRVRRAAELVLRRVRLGHLRGLPHLRAGWSAPSPRPCIRLGGGPREVVVSKMAHKEYQFSQQPAAHINQHPFMEAFAVIFKVQLQEGIVHATTTLDKFDPFDWRARASEQQPRHPRRRSRRGARLDGGEGFPPQPPPQGPRPQRGLPALGLRDDKEQVGEDELERRPRRIRRRRGRRPRRRRRTRRPSEEFSEKHPDLLRDVVAAAGRKEDLVSENRIEAQVEHVVPRRWGS